MRAAHSCGCAAQYASFCNSHEISQQIDVQSRAHPANLAHKSASSAALAAARHDAKDRARLEQTAAAVEQAWRSDDRRVQLTTDLAFHHAIAEATHNPVFSYLMGSLHRLLLDHMQLSQAGTEPKSGITDQVRAQHRELLRMILARDGKGATRAASRHIEFVRVRLNHLPPRA
ncbi:MAG TPA: FCD domain-containing protein [Nevskiaceae bacterium]|nr:FCD domain-containing protein [Nevskiaceae bacterium]